LHEKPTTTSNRRAIEPKEECPASMSERMSAAPKGGESPTNKGKEKCARAADTSESANSTVPQKARPSICRAAEELVCSISLGLPIDPVVAEDVRKKSYMYFKCLRYMHDD